MALIKSCRPLTPSIVSATPETAAAQEEMGIMMHTGAATASHM